MIWLCATPERRLKTLRLMKALAEGWDSEAQIIEGSPPNDGAPFIVWGQRFLAERLLRFAHEERRPFWHIDNGYWSPARGTETGYYRLTYRSLSPILFRETDTRRAEEKLNELKPWRDMGTHILLALPGPFFGRSLGMDMVTWGRVTDRTIRRQSSRPLKLRHKKSHVPLEKDLEGAWALVTHSSNVAVDAVIAGIPVFCMATCPAAPVAMQRFDDFESVKMPDRTAWLQSLACQQFTLDEMRDGTACKFMRRVEKQVDGDTR